MSQPAMAGGATPAAPRAILRGHKAQVHTAAFIRGSDRLVTGDAEGFVAVWDLTIMRARAVWKAHEDVMLGVRGWGHDRLITHGRDNKLVVWKLAEADEASLSRALPLDPSPEPRPRPRILHMLEVNTMNFCTFSFCEAQQPDPAPEQPEALVAVPNTLVLEAIDIFHLPSQRRKHTVKLGGKDGMAMALGLFHVGTLLTLVVAYENGVAAVAQLDSGPGSDWNVVYRAKTHSQPILSLDMPPNKEYFLTSSADAVISKHALPQPPPITKAEKTPTVDGEEDAKTTKHNVTSPTLGDTTERAPSDVSPEIAEKPVCGGVSLLAAALERSETKTASNPRYEGETKGQSRQMVTEPIKTINTKHAGQQGLQVRSDGRIFATAGWDSRVRVYSCKTMKELAVLKWHQVGCYALAFSQVGQATPDTDGAAPQEASGDMSVSKRIGDVTVKDKRIQHAKNAHWLAAGAKDGKVSLWEVY